MTTLKQKAQQLFLYEYYAYASHDYGTQLLIDAYVMGPIETLLYTTKRYTLYQVTLAQHDHRKLSLYPNLDKAILITKNAFVKRPDPNVFSTTKDNEEFVSIDTGDMLVGHEYEPGRDFRNPVALMFVDPARKNRCLGCVWPPHYALKFQHPDDESNQGPWDHGLHDYRHLIFTRFTQDYSLKGQTLKRLSMNLHSQRIIGDFDVQPVMKQKIAYSGNKRIKT